MSLKLRKLCVSPEIRKTRKKLIDIRKCMQPTGAIRMNDAGDLSEGVKRDGGSAERGGKHWQS